MDLHWKFEPLFDAKRIKIARGGRAGMKSQAFATAALIKGMEQSTRVLCTREHQVSIRDSVHRLLADKIDQYGLQGNYRVLASSIESRVNDTEFVFKGLRHNIGNVKSLEGFDICWVEEAAYVPQIAIDVLMPTMRKAGSEVWFSYNPDSATDPVHVIAESGRPDMVLIETSYKENNWLSDEMKAEAEFSRINDPDGYAHIWGGQVRSRSDAQVYGGQYVVEPFDPQRTWHGPYFGLDLGFKKSANALVKCWIADRRLWIEYEAWGRQTPLVKLPDLLRTVPEADRHTIRCDNARPETIHYLQTHGFPKATACKKWSGSVEDGVEYLRGEYEKIVIHPRCSHTLDDFRLYSHKIDRQTGDVMDAIVKEHDDAPDATRYAIEPVITRRRGIRRGHVIGSH